MYQGLHLYDPRESGLGQADLDTTDKICVSKTVAFLGAGSIFFLGLGLVLMVVNTRK